MRYFNTTLVEFLLQKKAPYPTPKHGEERELVGRATPKRCRGGLKPANWASNGGRIAMFNRNASTCFPASQQLPLHANATKFYILKFKTASTDIQINSFQCLYSTCLRHLKSLLKKVSKSIFSM
jgi:hypothetical protein